MIININIFCKSFRIIYMCIKVFMYFIQDFVKVLSSYGEALRKRLASLLRKSFINNVIHYIICQ